MFSMELALWGPGPRAVGRLSRSPGISPHGVPVSPPPRCGRHQYSSTDLFPAKPPATLHLGPASMTFRWLPQPLTTRPALPDPRLTPPEGPVPRGPARRSPAPGLTPGAQPRPPALAPAPVLPRTRLTPATPGMADSSCPAPLGKAFPEAPGPGQGPAPCSLAPSSAICHSRHTDPNVCNVSLSRCSVAGAALEHGGTTPAEQMKEEPNKRVADTIVAEPVRCRSPHARLARAGTRSRWSPCCQECAGLTWEGSVINHEVSPARAGTSLSEGARQGVTEGRGQRAARGTRPWGGA